MKLLKREILVGDVLFNASGTLETPWLVLGREAAAAIDATITQDESLTKKTQASHIPIQRYI